MSEIYREKLENLSDAYMPEKRALIEAYESILSDEELTLKQATAQIKELIEISKETGLYEEFLEMGFDRFVRLMNIDK